MNPVHISRIDLEVRHLKLLVALAEQGSLTAAARRLHLTQSALSHQLRDAEEKLQARLFDRSSKRLVPTPAGELALSTARAVLAELDHCESAIRAGRLARPPLLRVATECYTGYHWLPAVIAGFQKLHPAVEVRIDLASTHDPLSALSRSELDLAIIYSDPSAEQFRTLPLFTDEMLVLMGRRHPLAARRSLRAEDFTGQTLYVYPPKEDNLFLNRVLRPAGVHLGAIHEVPLTEAILEFVSSGLGLAFLAGWAAQPYLRSGKIVGRPLTGARWKRDWKAAVLPHGPVPAHLTDFIRLTRAQHLRASARTSN